MTRRLCKIMHFIFFLSLVVICCSEIAIAREMSVLEAGNFPLAQHDERLQIIQAETDIFIFPFEIDFGNICRFEKGVTKDFSLKKKGNVPLKWNLIEIEDWILPAGARVDGFMGPDKTSHEIKVTLKYIGNNNKPGNSNGELSIIQLRLESGNKIIVCQKEFPPGAYSQKIQFRFNDCIKTAIMHFTVSLPDNLLPKINLEPLRLDLGAVKAGEKMVKRLSLSNRGEALLKWYASVEGQESGNVETHRQWGRRYKSFLDDKKKDSHTTTYTIDKDTASLSGNYTLLNGYPCLAKKTQTLKYQFSGNFIEVFFSSHSSEGNLQFYTDDNLTYDYHFLLVKKDLQESLVVNDSPENPHVLALIPVNGQFLIEGVQFSEKEIVKQGVKWIDIFPDSGATLTEHDYVNIGVNTIGLVPGFYTGKVLFKSNGGEAEAVLSMEVVAAETSKIIDVYRYLKKSDYLYTADPQGDFKVSKLNGYIKEGIAFRLFTAGTPGTAEFYRWFNPQKGDHYYSYVLNLDRKRFAGYIYEGIIGNIGTSRLGGTKPLYRWYNPKTGRHFYTTDAGGEKKIKGRLYF